MEINKRTMMRTQLNYATGVGMRHLWEHTHAHMHTRTHAYTCACTSLMCVQYGHTAGLTVHTNAHTRTENHSPTRYWPPT